MADAPVIRMGTVASTMDEMASLLAAGPVEPWTAVVADYQQQGRGRAERSWVAPPHSALLTTIYAPISLEPDRIGLVAIAAGLAVADALTVYIGGVRLKWPNDVLLEDRKIAGILASTQLGTRIHASIGIGVNLTSAPPDAIALADSGARAPDPVELLGEILGAMRLRWAELEGGDFDRVRDRWNELAAWKEQHVVVPGDDSLKGRLIGIDDRGHLRLAGEAGKIVLTQSEIARGPVPPGPASYTSS
jgi:BirA family biotin operon repressor/biotin-[acetyl-CoA-carboxylase] ligase